MSASSATRDSQRKKVYDAERRVFPESFGGEQARNPAKVSVEQCQQFYDDLLKEAWTRRRWGNRTVRVGDGGGQRQALSFGGGYIGLPRWARTKVTMLHELAHELSGPDAHHGPVFARAFLELIEHVLGVEAATSLRIAYRDCRVRIGPALVLKPLKPLPAPPKLWRFEYTLDGETKTVEYEATDLRRALRTFQGNLPMMGDLVAVRAWKGRKAAVRKPTSKAAKRRRS